MTVERRIQTTAGILILFVLGTGLLLFWSSRLVESGIRGTKSTSQAVQSALMMTVLFEQHLLHGDKRTLRQWDKHRENLGQILNEMNSESIDRALLTDLKNKYRAVNSLAPRLMQMASTTDGDQRQDRRERQMLTSLTLLRLEKLANAANDLSGATQTLTLKRRHFVQEIIVAIGISMVIVILINIYLIRKSVVRPLKALSSGAERIGAGNFGYVADIKSDDEVGKLAQAFNLMIGRLRDHSTALRKANDELELRVQDRTAELSRSNSDLQQFAYVASHDLQEPLRNVASCLQLLEKKYKNKLDANADQYIYHAVESSVRMKALILDLLAYSRIGTKGKPPQRIDCEQILDLTVRNLTAAITDAGAVITHDPLPIITADDTQLLPVFQNLIQNGIKFRGDEPPQIHVSAVKNENEWIFSVKDNGIGIESRHLDRIFVIFQRLHKRSQYEGTGMGLAIVKKVVERHGGRVWVESEFGSGTTFYFTIPEKGKKP